MPFVIPSELANAKFDEYEALDRVTNALRHGTNQEIRNTLAEWQRAEAHVRELISADYTCANMR